MGNKSSTVVETPAFNEPINTAQSGLLKWKRCVFMSQKQYYSKSHLNKNMLCISETTTDVDAYVKNRIKEIASKLPNGKVPAPIYVMYAKKLEYASTIFGDCVDEALPYKRIIDRQKEMLFESLKSIPKLITKMTEIELKRNELTTETVGLNITKAFQPTNITKINELTKLIQSINSQINILQKELDDINNKIDENKNILKDLEEQKKGFKCINDENFEKYIVVSEKIFQDMDALYSSELSKFTFDKNKNYQIIMYFPNLNANSFYFSNFKDYTMHNQWMYSFIKYDGLLYNIIPISDPVVSRLKRLYDDPRNQSNAPFKNMIQSIIRIFVMMFEKMYPLSKELTQSCFNKGCVSDYGEDLEQMIPGYTKDSGQRKLNSNSKAPYYPRKCLRQPNYKANMFDDNEEFNKKLKENLLGKCLDNYKESLSKLDDSGTPPVNDVEPLLVDQLKKCAVQYRYDEIGNFNQDEGTDKYSVQYNQKILGELSLRKYSYPGVQEVIFPLFRLDENDASVSDYITYMPWGNKLLTSDYALNFDGDEKLENEPLLSMDNVYKLIVPTKNVSNELLHKICVFKNNTILYTLSEKSFDYCFNKKLKFESPGTLSLYGSIIINDTPSEKKQWSMTVVDISKALQPVSLGFNPSNGNLVAFDNGLNIVTSETLSKKIEASKAFFSGSEYNYNPEDMLSSFESYLRTLGYELGYDSFMKKMGDFSQVVQNVRNSGKSPDAGREDRITLPDGNVVNKDGTTVFNSEPYRGISSSGLLYDDDEEMKNRLEVSRSILTDVRNKYYS
jgi:hypothetical protein